MNTLCFVIAMQNEATPVITAMNEVTQKTVCGRKVYDGKLFGYSAAVIVCGVGKVNAAAGAFLAIDRYSPCAVINLGVAGGLNDTLHVGGIYAIEAAVQYDFDLTQLNGGIIGTLDEYSEPYLPLSIAKGFEKKKVGTGDRFNDSPADYKLLTKTLAADIREMELGAIAQVCISCGVKCYSFKIISDLAGSGSTAEQYRKNLNICFKSLEENLEKIVKAVAVEVGL